MTRKIHPITGRHTTLHSMLAEAMADERAVRGYVVWFEEDGTMHVGQVGVTLGDVSMAAIYLNLEACQTMQDEGS